MQGKFSWYPGHIKKAEEELKTKWLPLIDLVLEVVDSRVPVSGIYPDRSIWNNKKVIQIFSKKDLIKPHPYFRQSNFLLVDTRLPHFWKRKLESLIDSQVQEIKQKLDKQGRRRKLRIGVCGLPNVGKSTFLNSLAGLGKKTKTGNRPGITKQMQLIRSPNFDLLDTPGMMPHSLDLETSYKLALCGLLPSKLFAVEELAIYLQQLTVNLQDKWTQTYESSEFLVKAFQEGKLGKFYLDCLD